MKIIPLVCLTFLQALQKHQEDKKREAIRTRGEEEALIKKTVFFLLFNLSTHSLRLNGFLKKFYIFGAKWRNWLDSNINII